MNSDNEGAYRATIAPVFIRAIPNVVCLDQAMFRTRHAEKRIEDPFMVIRNGNLDHARELISSGLINVRQTRWSGFTLLHRAAEIGHTALCELLIDAGIDVNTRSARGWLSPLHVALGNGYTETAERLIARGASPWLRNKAKQDPFEYGAQKGFKKICDEFRLKVLKQSMERDLRRQALVLDSSTSRSEDVAENDIHRIDELKTGKEEEEDCGEEEVEER